MDDFLFIKILIGFIIFLITIIITTLQNFKMKHYKKTHINFDEFDDIEKVKQRELKEKEQVEHESLVLEKVYNDTYQKYAKSNNANIGAYVKAIEATEQAKKDLYNFKFIDSIEVEKDEFKDGSTINSLRENGYNFDVELFKKWCRQIFGCIKIGTNDQLNIVKNFISEDLYHRFQHQIEQFDKRWFSFYNRRFNN